MERMIISYVDFRSCHKHFPNSLPLLPLKRTRVSSTYNCIARMANDLMNLAPCQLPSDVGCGVGPLSPGIYPDIYPDNCRGASSRVSRLQCCNQWQCWVGGLIVRCCLKHGAWSSQAPTPQWTPDQTTPSSRVEQYNMGTPFLIRILVMITAVTCSPLIKDAHKHGR